MKWKIERKFREIVLEVGAEEKDYGYVYDKILTLLDWSLTPPTRFYSTTLFIQRGRFLLFIDTKTKEIWVRH